MRYLSLALVLFTLGCSLRRPPSPAALEPAPDQNPGLEKTDVLFYGGEGSWGDEIQSLKEILYAHGKTYLSFDDNDFNDLNADDLERFSLVIFPGGDSDLATDSLTPDVRELIRISVRNGGLNYLGFCAGAWMAISPEPAKGKDEYGFRLVDGPWLKQTPYQEHGLEYTLADAIFPNGTHRNLLWYGGPVTPDIPGGVVVKYPDGTPAITQIRSGEGFVILSGLHPAANKKILSDIGLYNKEAIDPDFAWQLLDSAIRGVPLPAF